MLRKSLCPLAIVLLAMFASAPARAADDAASEPPPTKSRDSKFSAGATVTAFGALTLFGGAAILADAELETENAICDEFSCFSRGRQNPARGVGVTLMASGATLAAFGLTSVYSSESEAQPFEHRSDGMMGAGIFFTGLAVAGIVGSDVLWTYATFEDEQLLAVAPIMLLASGGFIGLGVPLWIRGARYPNRPHDEELDGDDVLVRRSPAMMNAGIGLTTIGALVTLKAIPAAVAVGLNKGDVDDEAAPFMFLGSLLAGGSLLAVGAPLWAKGAKRVPASEAYAGVDDRWIPDVQVGAGNARMTWQF